MIFKLFLIMYVFILFRIEVVHSATSLELRFLHDDNVFQTSDQKKQDSSLRIAGAYSDSDQYGKLSVEQFFRETDLNNLTSQYRRKFPALINPWENQFLFMGQQYFKKNSGLANDNINYLGAGLELSRKFQLGSFPLRVIPTALAFFFSGASRRSDLRLGTLGESNLSIDNQWKVFYGLGLTLNLSTDRDYSYVKTLLYGGADYLLDRAQKLSFELALSQVRYTSRYGTTAAIYENRGRAVSYVDQNESVSSRFLSALYERTLGQSNNLGAGLSVYSQSSLSELLDYNSNVIFAWIEHFF